MIDPVLRECVGAALGVEPVAGGALGGGCIAEVLRLELADGRRVVVKRGAGDASLVEEAWMLEQLAGQGWPVPERLHVEDTLLILAWVPGDGVIDSAAERAAAELLAPLHAIPQPAFGFHRDTNIAGLHQGNATAPSWIPFFAERRLLAMATQARDAGRIDASLQARIERLAGRLERWLLEPAHPSLIHGDLWTGNILFQKSSVAAVIDPACYWGHPEIELAFTTLFSTFGSAFFQRYNELRPIPEGFHEERKALYNLYPLLVHQRLFGGHYRHSIEQTLARFGC